MFRLVVRKLVANRWLTLCLLAGFAVAVALAAGVPVYTDGILQRMLTRDLEIFQERNDYFPGRYSVSTSFVGFFTENVGPLFPQVDPEMRLRLPREVGLPVLASTTLLTLDFLQALPAVQREDEPEMRYVVLEALSGAEGRLRILHGRMFSPATPDGTIEVVVTEEAFRKLDLLLDEVYIVTDLRELLDEPLRVKVVGIFGMADPGDPWWFHSLANYGISLIADYGLVRSRFGDSSSPLLTGATWSWAFDYHAIRLPDLRRLVAALERQLVELDANRMSWDLPMREILQEYFHRERTLTALLWFLQVPVFVLLAFYVLMTSRLLVRHDADEIAILKSRGARTGQVFAAYLLEGALLATAALAIGPPLGLLVCRIVGAASGFLEFVQRSALPAVLSRRAWLAGAACAALAVLTMLGPALRASRTTIVIAKQRRSRAEDVPLWRRAFLDIVLLALAAYGYYGYRTQQRVLAITRVEALALPIDPLLFLVSTCFIIGAGLLCLRLYPLLLRLVFRLGRAVWPPGLYATFVGVSRGGGREQFLMMFLVLTLAIGVLDATTARTINRNVEDRIRYAAGADVTLLEDWPSNKPPPSVVVAVPGAPAAPAAPEGRLIYREPDFGKFTRLEGVELATKVFVRRNGFADNGRGTYADIVVMGVVPDEFARVAWFSPGLLPHHWHQYLNLLAASPKAMLVSDTLAKRLELAPGESIGLSWEDQDSVDGVIYATVPLWPTWNPYGEGAGGGPGLVVANLSYLQTALALEPYEVWMKLAAGADVARLYRQLEELEVPLRRIDNAGQALIDAKNDPMLQGTNGTLTLGFVVTMLVSAIGFLITWIIVTQERRMQYGVFRAMGLSRRRVLGMIVWEQLMVSGVAVALGAAIGGIAGGLFVPLLQLTTSAVRQVPPYQVITDPGDYLRVLAVVGVMLAACLAVLGAVVYRLRVAESLKLGEE